MIVLPINNQPNQSFKTTIPLGSRNVTLGFFVYWNEMAGYWQMNIADVENNALVSALPLVGGNYPAQNILRQYEYLNIGKAYILPLSEKLSQYPQVGDWGTNFVLIWDE